MQQAPPPPRLQKTKPHATRGSHGKTQRVVWGGIASRRPRGGLNRTSRGAWLTRTHRRVVWGGVANRLRPRRLPTRKWVRRLPLMSAILAPHPACVWLPNAEPFSNAHAYTHGGRTRVGFYWPSPGLQPCRAGNNPHTRAYAVGCLSVVITRGAWYRPGWFDHESGPPTVQCGSLTHRHLPAAVFHTHIHAHGDAAHTAHSQVGATAASGLVLRCVVGALLA